MPLPKPQKDEARKDFLSRCMGNSEMNSEFTDQKQRYAVCNSLWRKSKSKSKTKKEAEMPEPEPKPKPEDVEKTFVYRYEDPSYYTISGKTIVDLGYDLPGDATQLTDVDAGDSYALLLFRGYDKVEAKMLDEETTLEQATAKALDLVENNKNEITRTKVLQSIQKSYAGRALYRTICTFAFLSKEEEAELLKGRAQDQLKQTVKENVGISGDVFKFENEIVLRKANWDKKLVYGVVYEPDTVDTHGDWAAAEEIEKAAHNFMRNVRASGKWTNKDHKAGEEGELSDVEIVESFIAPVAFMYEGTDAVVKKGSWVIVSKVLNPDLQKAIESGDTAAYSMEGTGNRV